jgi:hypothetical protein
MKGINELTPGDGRGYVNRLDCWSLSSHRLQMSGLTKNGSVLIASRPLIQAMY